MARPIIKPGRTAGTDLVASDARWLARAIAILALTVALSLSPFEFQPINASESDRTSPTVYRLDAMDKVRIKVFEWRPAIDEVYEWKALNDEYVLGPTGTISLPLLGDIEARGATLSEVSVRIGERMRERIGLVTVPKISIDVVEYRPFYVSGKIDKPGEYPYRPGLNVLQAVTIAGGLDRGEKTGRQHQRELIKSEGDLNLLSNERVSLLIKRARLEAEIRNDDELPEPPTIDMSDPKTREIFERERARFHLNYRGTQSRLEVMERRRKHLASQVETLKAQIATHNKSADLARSELDTVESLIKRKLTVEPRRLAALRNVFQLESVGLRLEADLRVIYEAMAKAESEIEEFRSDLRTGAIAELGTTDLRISQIEHEIATSQRLYIETVENGGSAAAASLAKAEEVYTIVRTSGGRIEEFTAAETTLVRPGDTIKVDLELPELMISDVPFLAGPKTPTALSRFAPRERPAAEFFQRRRAAAPTSGDIGVPADAVRPPAANAVPPRGAVEDMRGGEVGPATGVRPLARLGTGATIRGSAAATVLSGETAAPLIEASPFRRGRARIAARTKVAVVKALEVPPLPDRRPAHGRFAALVLPDPSPMRDTAQGADPARATMLASLRTSGHSTDGKRRLEPSLARIVFGTPQPRAPQSRPQRTAASN